MKALLFFISGIFIVLFTGILLVVGVGSFRHDFGYTPEVLVADAIVRTGSGSGNNQGLKGYLKGKHNSTEMATLSISDKLLDSLGLSRVEIIDRVDRGVIEVPIWKSRGRYVRYRGADSEPPLPFGESLGILGIALLGLVSAIMVNRWAGPLSKYVATTALFLGFSGLAVAQANLPDYIIPINTHRSQTGAANVYLYDPPYRARGSFNSVDELDLSYPEQVFESIMSATDAEWEARHTQGGLEQVKPKAARHYASVRNRDQGNAQFTLLLKLTWTGADGVERALIKFRFSDGIRAGNPTAIYHLVKESGNWKISAQPMDHGIFFAFSIVKDRVLRQLLLNSPDLPTELREVRAGSVSNGAFDLKKFGDYYMQLQMDETANQRVLELLNGDPGW